MHVTIEPFVAADHPAFASLNREWLDGYGLTEAADQAQLDDPFGTILARGGQIFMARAANDAVGCCAAIPHDASTIEVAKLAVAPAARGQGVGRRLVTTVLEFGRSRGFETAVLTSNHRLTAALKLYESIGFRYAAVPPGVPYVTVDVYMTRPLT